MVGRKSIIALEGVAIQLACCYVYIKEKAERRYLAGLNGANVEKPGGKGFSCSVGNVALYVIILHRVIDSISFGLGYVVSRAIR